MNESTGESLKKRFTLSREVDLLALVALFFSVASLGWQVKLLLSGPRIELTHNDRVNIVLYDKDGLDVPSEQLTVLFNVGLSALNSGGEKYHAIVKDMRLLGELTFSGKKRSFEFVWLHFETYIDGKKGRPVSTSTTSANSLLVPGRDQIAKQVTFAGMSQPSKLPRTSKTDPLSWKVLRDALEENSWVTLSFHAILADGSPSGEPTCHLRVLDADITELENRRWTTLYCRDDYRKT